MSRNNETGWLALAVLAAVAATLVFATSRAIPVARTMLASHDGIGNADEPALDRFGESLALYAARVDGRSPFFDPPRPVPPPPPPRPPTEPTEPAPTPPPARYGGPAIIAMVGNQVWFTPDLRIRVGDEETDDLRVIDVDAPWSAEVEWKGVSFTVPFLERDERLAQRRAESIDPESSPDSADEADADPARATQKPVEPETELE